VRRAFAVNERSQPVVLDGWHMAHRFSDFRAGGRTTLSPPLLAALV